MKIEISERTNIEHEREVAVYADGGAQPTHAIEVRNWRDSITLNIRSPQGWVSVPLDVQAAVAVADAIVGVAVRVARTRPATAPEKT